MSPSAAPRERTLFLLDGHALVYRAYFAFLSHPRVNTKGLDTGCIFGFVNTLSHLLRNGKPSHLAVAFDTRTSFRRAWYQAYKANREKQPEPIRDGIVWIRTVLEAMRMPVLSAEGYEADDVIGTIAIQAAEDGFCVYVVSPDKDFAQLVRRDIQLYQPGRAGRPAKTIGLEDLKEAFGIENPEQIIDKLALMGDSVDNIPGVPGVGEKTAIRLLNAYHSVETLIAESASLGGKLGKSIGSHKEALSLYKRLVTIDTSAPVTWQEEAARIKPFKGEVLADIFRELEFNTLSKHFFGDMAVPAAILAGSSRVGAEEGIASPQICEQVPNSPAAWRALGESLCQQTHFVLHPYGSEQKKPSIFSTVSPGGLAICHAPDTVFCLPFSSFQKALRHLKKALESHDVTKISLNSKALLHCMGQWEFRVGGALFDVALAHHLINPEQSQKIAAMARKYLQASVAAETVSVAEEASLLFRLYPVLQREIERANLSHCFHEVECPLIRVLASMEQKGLGVDERRLEKTLHVCKANGERLRQDIVQMAGHSFLVGSPKQLGVVLFDELRLMENPPKTKTGHYATGERVLGQLRGTHPIVEKVIAYRAYEKLKNTYLEKLLLLAKEGKGRIHTTINQRVTATGRLSTQEPNLQAIPVRTAMGQEIREAFVAADADFLLLAADYSQIELRIAAHFSQDPAMREAFAQGMDIHAVTAARIYEKGANSVTPAERRVAKAVNFGILYGMSAFRLSQSLGIPKKEAENMIERYFAEFSALNCYLQRVLEEAREKGYVETLLGRKRFLPEINSQNATLRKEAERRAINTPIQGTAADIIKMAMVNIGEWLRQEGLRSHLLLQIHDELLFEVHREDLEVVKEKVAYFMEHYACAMPSNFSSACTGYGPTPIPLSVSMGTGRNWLEAHRV